MVAIVVIDNHYVFVAMARCDREAARLVAENLAGDFDGLLENPISSPPNGGVWRVVER